MNKEFFLNQVHLILEASRVSQVKPVEDSNMSNSHIVIHHNGTYKAMTCSKGREFEYADQYGVEVIKTCDTFKEASILIHKMNLGRKFILVDVPTNSQEAAFDTDKVLRGLRPENHKDDEEYNPPHLHIDPQNFYWEKLNCGEYGFNYEKPGDSHQWAMRTLLWHLSAAGVLSYEKNPGFVEHINEIRERDITLIFLHTQKMSKEQVGSFVFLLESMGYTQHFSS